METEKKEKMYQHGPISDQEWSLFRAIEYELDQVRKWENTIYRFNQFLLI